MEPTGYYPTAPANAAEILFPRRMLLLAPTGRSFSELAPAVTVLSVILFGAEFNTETEHQTAHDAARRWRMLRVPRQLGVCGRSFN